LSESFQNNYENDYEALTSGCGFVGLKNWSTVTLTGEDRHSFLHNICTNDIRRLSTGEGCEAFCTDVKGKIVAHVFVLAQEDRLELLTVPEQAGALIAHLDRYIICEDVQLHDRSSEVCWTLVCGTEAGEVLDKAAGNVAGSVTAALENPWQQISCIVGEAACHLTRCDLFWSPSFLLRCTYGELAGVEQSLQAGGAKSCSAAALTCLRIESGLPFFGSDFTGANLPQEVDRDSLAISFNKGCYLGQETIARIDAMGHVNQKVVVVKWTGSAISGEGPELGLDLTSAEKSVGKVTSGCWSPRWKAPLALATVRRGSNAIGTELASELGPATLVEPA